MDERSAIGMTPPKKGEVVEVYSVTADDFVDGTVTSVTKNHFTYTARGGRITGTCPVSWYRDRLGWRWRAQ